MSLYKQEAEAPVGENAHVQASFDGISLHNTSYFGIGRVDIPAEDLEYSNERDRAINHRTDAGIKPMTKEEQDFERSASWQLVKKFTMNIFSMDFTKFSFPVAYSEPRSFLERTADLFSFLATNYIDKAIDCGIPEERLSLLAVGVIAGFHLQIKSKKPWNPVIGETYVGRWENGATIYGEQTSHHPPISDFQIFGPDNKWNCHAHCKFTISSGLTQVEIIQNGTFHLELDGTHYEFQFPNILALGILKGDRIVRLKGAFEIRDVTNDLTMKIDISPKKNPKKGLKSPIATTVYGGLVTGKDSLSHMITGDYSDAIYVDGCEKWALTKDFSAKAAATVDDWELLYSDVRYRLDRAYLIRGQPENADLAKVAIEELQRREAKLRVSVK